MDVTGSLCLNAWQILIFFFRTYNYYNNNIDFVRRRLRENKQKKSKKGFDNISTVFLWGEKKTGELTKRKSVTRHTRVICVCLKCTSL